MPVRAFIASCRPTRHVPSHISDLQNRKNIVADLLYRQIQTTGLKTVEISRSLQGLTSIIHYTPAATRPVKLFINKFPSSETSRRQKQGLDKMLRRELLMRRGLNLKLCSLPRSKTLTSVATDINKLPRPGERLHGFTVLKTKHIPELEITAVQLSHDKTGANYLHVSRDDKNNVFSVGFKTNPTDDTGTPHILEHITLCGSKRYPVRDPFFKMLNRSLSNYMNAFTSGDHTTYPFATTNRTDFYNLMDVYMDATLHPLLNGIDFKQEGWRIGPEDVANQKSPLLFKGVVYNEMKGQMSDASYLFNIRFQDHIFPDIHNSGGDPAKIPDLTSEQLRSFHKEHYNPSNSKIFTYGDMPLAQHLEKLNEALSPFNKMAIHQDLKQPIKIERPMEVIVYGPVDPLAERSSQIKTSLSWIMNDTTDLVETFGLGVLSSLLMDGYGSPLYRGLIETKLGADFSPNTGYDGSSKKAIFSIGLQRVSEENLPKVGHSIRKILEECYEKGFEQRKVDGILHQLELGLKHKTADFGLAIMRRIKQAWFNGIEPLDALAWQEILEKFKEVYAKGSYFEGLIKKYLLHDNHLTFTMIPSENYTLELTMQEAARLQQKIAHSKKDRAQFEQEEAELMRIQEEAKKQDLSCLPTLHVNDIPRAMERKSIDFGNINGVSVQWRVAPTNGLTYFRAINVFDDLPDNLKLFLPLFTEAIFGLGTKSQRIEEIEDLIKLKTGGLSASLHVSTNHSDLNSVEQGLAFSGFCLDRNIRDMYELLRTILTETDFDQPMKLNSLVQGIASGFVNSMAESGHTYARLFSAAHLTPGAEAAEIVSGMAQIRLISNLALTEDYSEAIHAMKEIAEFAASKLSLRTAITCSPDSVVENENALSSFLSSLPTTKNPRTANRQIKYDTATLKSFFPLPYQVSYTSMCMRTVPYTQSDGAALNVLAQILTHKHLHHEIREKGGAYGGGAFHQANGGLFGYYSYRDPNVLNTLKVMRDAGEWATSNDLTVRNLEEAKLSIFQAVDAPTSVNEEGMTRFAHGITDDMRQKRREQLLDVTVQDVKRVAQRYLVDQVSRDKTATTVLGEKKEWAEPAKGWAVLELGLIGQTSGEEQSVEL